MAFAGVALLWPRNQDQVIRLQADAWMPFNGKPGEARPGYVIEIAEAIFAARGLKVRYDVRDWEEAVAAVERGEADAVIGASPEEVGGLVLAEEPMARVRTAIFVRSVSPWQYQDLRSLRGMSLGAISGYAYWDALDVYISRSEAPDVVLYDGTNPLKEAVIDLNNGQIDALVDTDQVFAWYVQDLGLSPGAFRPVYVHEAEPLYLAFTDSGRGRRLAREFDEGIRQLRESGRLEVILARYGLRDWQ